MARRSSRRRENEVLVDAAAWIALINTRDQLHQRAWQVYRQLQQQRWRLVTTEFILIEVADALARPPLRPWAVTFIDGLRNPAAVEILPTESGLLASGWGLYCRRPDQEWGLTDCISFAVMTERSITDAFTSDHHFEQAGFRKLL